jgi:formylglycine-generating enzyme required for sulfatase activity
MASLVHRACLAGAEPKRLGVFRGGAFDLSQLNVRCAARASNDPASRYYSNGFRIVVSPFL